MLGAFVISKPVRLQDICWQASLLFSAAAQGWTEPHVTFLEQCSIVTDRASTGTHPLHTARLACVGMNALQSYKYCVHSDIHPSLTFTKSLSLSSVSESWHCHFLDHEPTAFAHCTQKKSFVSVDFCFPSSLSNPPVITFSFFVNLHPLAYHENESLRLFGSRCGIDHWSSGADRSENTRVQQLSARWMELQRLLQVRFPSLRIARPSQ